MVRPATSPISRRSRFEARWSPSFRALWPQARRDDQVPSASRLIRHCWASAFEHVIEEPMSYAIGRPLRAQAGSALDPTKGRQKVAVELAGVGAFYPYLHMEAIGRVRNGASDDVFEHWPDRGERVRADFGTEMEGAIGHCVSAPWWVEPFALGRLRGLARGGGFFPSTCPTNRASVKPRSPRRSVPHTLGRSLPMAPLV